MDMYLFTSHSPGISDVLSEVLDMIYKKKNKTSKECTKKEFISIQIELQNSQT
jgi:hypothetical protein